MRGLTQARTALRASSFLRHWAFTLAVRLAILRILSNATSPLAGIRCAVNDRNHRDEFSLRGEEDQVGKSVDLREAYRRKIEREQLGLFRDLIKPAIDFFAKRIGEPR